MDYEAYVNIQVDAFFMLIQSPFISKFSDSK